MNNFSELKEYASSFGVTLSEGNTEVLSTSLTVEGKNIPNRLLIQPVEGTDADENGNPGELTKRRYLRYAKGGAGTIWFEAVALSSDFRSNKRQLILDEKTVDEFSRIVENVKETAIKENGYEPILIVQITNPGRTCLLSKPAYENYMWEKVSSSHNQPIVSDDEIARLSSVYGDSAKLAKKAGFDGVEVKACHRTFINELLAARAKPGRYGGSFENRVRHLTESLAAVRAKTDNMIVTVRLNHYDGIPYPNGFGMKDDGSPTPDGTEPIKLIKELHNEYGIELINCSSSNPSFELFENKSCDNPLFTEPMNAVKTAGIMHLFAKEIKNNIPEVKVVATNFSYFKQYGATIGAGIIERNEADLIGFGRQGLAYPDFAKDILINGKMDEKKVCIYCGGCNRMMGSAKGAGCIAYDEVYKN